MMYKKEKEVNELILKHLEKIDECLKTSLVTVEKYINGEIEEAKTLAKNADHIETESDFIRVKENNIPVIICPRSNDFFGIQPNYELIKKTETIFLIGTDNVMLNNPSILEEIFFIETTPNTNMNKFRCIIVPISKKRQLFMNNANLVQMTFVVFSL